MPTGGEASDRSDDPAMGTVSVDVACHLLSDPDRRAILTYLTAVSGETATFQGISDHLIESKRARTDEWPEPEQIAMHLHHVHLPKLAEYGVIEYDARSKTVRYRPADRVESLLEWIQEETMESD